MELPEINARIMAVVKHFCNGSVSKLAFLLPSISQQRLSRLFNVDSRTGKYPVATTDILQAICEMIVDISPEWLLMGRGNMLRDQDAPSAVPEIVVHNQDTRISAEKEEFYKGTIKEQQQTIIGLSQQVGELKERIRHLSAGGEGGAFPVFGSITPPPDPVDPELSGRTGVPLPEEHGEGALKHK